MSRNKPLFVLNDATFMGIDGQRTAVEKLFKGECVAKLFGPIKRFYVHGELCNKVGYDIANFVSGEFEDKREQPALLVDANLEVHNAVIVMVTANGTSNKYAFLVSEDRAEIDKALIYLWTGEWLNDGWERF